MNNLTKQLYLFGLSESDWNRLQRNREVTKLRIGNSYLLSWCGMPVTGELIFKYKDRFQIRFINPLSDMVELSYFLSSDIIRDNK